ncbi:hypothetical protein COE51_10815 [Bacillus pseudomycoides]|nr:hypothetical protein COE51_10815 [Bacillus pseudomycoides]
MEYRGIKLADGVKLYNKDGSFYEKIKDGLDILANMLTEKGHILESEYHGNSVKVLIDFKCGHDAHWIKPNHYKRNVGCPKCGKINRAEKNAKRNKEEFPLLVESKNHVLLSEYGKNASVKVLIDFKCGHDAYWIAPKEYMKGHGCNKCGIIQATEKTSGRARKEFYSLVKSNGHVWLSGEYKNNHTKVQIDFKCGHKPHWIQPNSYKEGHGCPDCSYIVIAEKQSKQAREDFPLLVEAGGHVLLSDYISSKEKVLIDFKCGHKPSWVQPSVYKRGFGCVKCAGTCPEQAKEDLLSLLESNKHKWVKGEYTNSKTKILIDFKCGHKPHWVTPANYKKGYGCPSCSESKGEKIILEWLEQKGIPYKAQYMFPNRKWKYDFMLPLENIVIEIQGIQHYEESYFHTKGKRTFTQEQVNDRAKRKFVEGLGYRFIEVDYREGKPELALQRFLDQFNKI